jgi:hypothetical protein
MQSINLTLVCDEIDNISPSLSIQGAPLTTIFLDDVDVDSLMIQLVKKLDPETILDYLKDDVIKEYLK